MFKLDEDKMIIRPNANLNILDQMSSNQVDQTYFDDLSVVKVEPKEKIADEMANEVVSTGRVRNKI